MCHSSDSRGNLFCHLVGNDGSVKSGVCGSGSSAEPGSDAALDSNQRGRIGSLYVDNDVRQYRLDDVAGATLVFDLYGVLIMTGQVLGAFALVIVITTLLATYKAYADAIVRLHFTISVIFC